MSRIRSSDLTAVRSFNLFFLVKVYPLWFFVKIKPTSLISILLCSGLSMFSFPSMQLPKTVLPNAPLWVMSCCMHFCHSSRKPCLIGQAEIAIPFPSSEIYSTYFQVKNECYLGLCSLPYIINFKIFCILHLPFITYNFGFLEF